MFCITFNLILIIGRHSNDQLPKIIVSVNNYYNNKRYFPKIILRTRAVIISHFRQITWMGIGRALGDTRKNPDWTLLNAE